MTDSKPSLRALLVCEDVLQNSRNSSVISIINVFNELQVSQFPAHVDSICFVAVYSGSQGEFEHHFEIWEKDQKIGDTPQEKFFLEDRNSLFHMAAYLDGMVFDKPRHFIVKAILNGELVGETTLGIYKPL